MRTQNYPRMHVGFMVADLALNAAARKLEGGQSEVTILDMGAGSLVLEQILREQLATSRLQDTVKIAVADINPAVADTGLRSGLADRGAIWDWNRKSLTEIIDEVGGDVLVFAEVLEHIPYVISNFARPQLRTAVETHQASLVGSVPNALQFAELRGYLAGTRAPHQLVKPMRDPTFDHVSHFTYASLSELCAEAGYADAKNIYIASNGVQLNKTRVEIDYPAGLVYPQLGHRLIFLACSE